MFEKEGLRCIDPLVDEKKSIRQKYLRSQLGSCFFEFFQLRIIHERESEDISIFCHAHQELVVKANGYVSNHPDMVVMRVDAPIRCKRIKGASAHVLDAQRTVL